MFADSNNIVVCFKWWLQKERERERKNRRFKNTQESYLLHSDRPTCFAINYSSTVEGSFLSKRYTVKQRPTTMAQIEQIRERSKKKELIKIHSSVLKLKTVWNRSKGVCTRIQLECNTCAWLSQCGCSLAVHTNAHAVTYSAHNTHRGNIKYFFHHLPLFSSWLPPERNEFNEGNPGKTVASLPFQTERFHTVSLGNNNRVWAASLVY